MVKTKLSGECRLTLTGVTAALQNTPRSLLYSVFPSLFLSVEYSLPLSPLSHSITLSLFRRSLSSFHSVSPSFFLIPPLFSPTVGFASLGWVQKQMVLTAYRFWLVPLLRTYRAVTWPAWFWKHWANGSCLIIWSRQTSGFQPIAQRLGDHCLGPHGRIQ